MPTAGCWAFTERAAFGLISRNGSPARAFTSTLMSSIPRSDRRCADGPDHSLSGLRLLCRPRSRNVVGLPGPADGPRAPQVEGTTDVADGHPPPRTGCHGRAGEGSP